MEEEDFGSSLRDSFFDHFGRSETVKHGKTFISLPSETVYSGGKGEEDDEGGGQAMKWVLRQHPKFLPPEEDRAIKTVEDHAEKREEEEGDGHHLEDNYQASLLLLQEKESSLQETEGAVNHLLVRLDEAFSPQSIYGDIQPDEDLLPSQVTLLRLRRKKQEVAIRRYRFQKAVKKYIECWRRKMLKRYHSLRCDRVVRNHLLKKGFVLFQSRLLAHGGVKRELQAMSYFTAKMMVMFFSLWEKRTKSNLSGRIGMKRFSPCRVAWDKWRRGLRRHVLSSLVMMQAEFTAYHCLLRKYGRKVFTALHVKRPGVNPRVVRTFYRLRSLRRGMSQLIHCLQVAKTGLLSSKKADIPRKKRCFCLWQSHVRYCRTKSAIMWKERQAAKGYPSTGRRAPIQFGLRKFVRWWAVVTVAKRACHDGQVVAVVSHFNRLARQLFSALSFCILLAKRRDNSRLLADSVIHLKRMRLGLGRWKYCVNCQSEDTTAHIGRFNACKRHDLVMCVERNVRAKRKFVLSKVRLDDTSARLHHLRHCWARVSSVFALSRHERAWAVHNDHRAEEFHEMTLQHRFLAEWRSRHGEARSTQQSITQADVHFCASVMREGFEQWQLSTQNAYHAGPSLAKADSHYFKNISSLFLNNLWRGGVAKRNIETAEDHWRAVRCGEAIAAFASNVSAGRQSASRMVTAHPDLPPLASRQQQQLLRDFLSRREYSLAHHPKITVAAPKLSLFSHSFTLMLCNIHEGRTAKRLIVKEWVEFVNKRRADRLYEAQVESTHHFPRLLYSGLDTWKGLITRRVEGRVRERRMEDIHGVYRSRNLFALWKLCVNKSSQLKATFGTMDSVRQATSLKQTFVNWYRVFKEQKWTSQNHAIAHRTFIARVSSLFLRALVRRRRQGSQLKKCVAVHHRRKRLRYMSTWAAWLSERRITKQQYSLSLRHESLWHWRDLRRRVIWWSNQRRVLKHLDEDAKHHLKFYLLGQGLLKLGLWARRRGSLKKAYVATLKKREAKMSNNSFRRLVEFKLEGDALVQKGCDIKKRSTRVAGMLQLQYHYRRLAKERNSISVAVAHCIRMKLLLFFSTHRKNVKVPLQSLKKLIGEAVSSHHISCQRRRLREWKRNVIRKVSMKKKHLAVITRFKQQRSFRIFSMRIKRDVVKKRLHRKRLRKLLWYQSSFMMKVWRRKVQMSEYFFNNSEKSDRLFSIKKKTMVMSWFKKLQRLRRAALEVSYVRRKAEFNRFYACFLSLHACRELINFAQPLVRNVQLVAIRRAWSLWRYFCRVEDVALSHEDTRIERCFTQSVSTWFNRTQELRLHRHRRAGDIESFRLNWLKVRLREVFSNLLFNINENDIERHRIQKCRRNLFRRFRRRAYEHSANQRENEQKLSSAQRHYLRSVEEFGFKFLVYRVRMKNYLRHEAFLQHRDYDRSRLHKAMQHLHHLAIRSRHHQHQKSAVDTRRRVQQMRRAIHALDSAVARRWAVVEETRLAQRELQVKQLLRRLMGFRRVVQCQKKRRHDSNRHAMLVD